MNQQFNDVIANIERLPMPNPTALEVVQLCSTADVSVSKLVNIISIDQSLTAQVLRIANSSYYNYPKMIYSIDRAIIILGFNLLKDIALSIAFHSFYKGFEKSDVFDFQELWNHSVSTALTGRALALRYDPENKDLYYIAGLLHDIGKLAMSKSLPNDFFFLVEKSRQENIRLDEAEKSTLGFHHGDLGASLLESWHLPDILIDMVRYHHHPEKFEGNHEQKKQIRFIYLSNILAHFIQDEFVDKQSLSQYDAHFPEIFSFSDDEFEEIINHTRTLISENQQMFSIHQI